MNTDNPSYQRAYTALVEFESTVASKRRREVHLNLRWQGRRRTTRPRLGFKFVKGEDGQIYEKPDADQRELMLWIARQFAHGQNSREIALALDRERVPRMKLETKPKPGERRSKEFRYVKHPSGWDSASVLRNNRAWLRICRMEWLDPLTGKPAGQTAAEETAMAGT
ncbi:MAG TPA: hypothetical protein VGX76_09035 [Pirellulales bacterium]|jgi:hypothetical protein|nr:hypothetical protein [Pirellulales bacterium]HEV3022601.1 hypothetical protein [Pirellulales bacterium]